MLRRLFLTALLTLPLAAPAMAQSCDTSLQLVNRSSTTVLEFYFSTSSDANWGTDRLGTEVLAAGQTKNFDTGAPGAHDFRVVLDGGRNAELRNVDICVTSQIVVTANGIEAH
ncbi:MAG TPA: hypothetical protein VGM87_12315 [Roseomonas sp.]|jgi:hypothetical protein